MKLITLEEHFGDRRIIRANESFNPPAPEQPKELQEFYKSHFEFGEALFDIKNKRLPYMDKNRITMQVLSYTSPVSDRVSKSEAIRLCPEANEILAGHIAESPDRFAGFATLPMAAPEEAADELERCVKDYHFCGALLAGQY